MCSYCGCLSNTVVGDLAAEHEQIIDAAGELRRAAGDVGAVRRAARRLRGLLHPHTAKEEAGLFAELGVLGEFGEHVASLCAEHDDLDTDLDRLVDGEAADPDRVEAFWRRLRLHIDREENGLFPAAVIALDGDAWGRAAMSSGATGVVSSGD